MKEGERVNYLEYFLCFMSLMFYLVFRGKVGEIRKWNMCILVDFKLCIGIW